MACIGAIETRGGCDQALLDRDFLPGSQMNKTIKQALPAGRGLRLDGRCSIRTVYR